MGNQSSYALFTKMRSYAAEHHVPIMEEQGIDELIELLQRQEPKKLLELGTAIGYSALRIAEALPDAHIDTIERDLGRYEKALEYIGESSLESRVRAICADALEVERAELDAPYDAIFIDAAKGQYERFFEKYERLLSDNGMIYCDNMSMHGMTELPIKQVPKRKRTMIRNIRSFREKMVEHPRFHCELLAVGDGLLVCTKK
ncbi:O-methyltransferase [Planococcus sp. ISL-109]|uniref:O-methyltransferase n=1 Tax=Planococcus sp. ISL-109 TaxID=2819166 RepID=UPI001BE73666|nr:O-methyltransferase [Planococcus sp. ISL-109]MBT2582375.1 O-methyltransferase [Planococcus sp. ISL-109]